MMSENREIFKSIVSSRIATLISNVKNEITHFQKQYVGFQPKVILLQNENAKSTSSISSFCSSTFKTVSSQCGIDTECIDVSQGHKNVMVLDMIKKLNLDPKVNGIISMLSNDQFEEVTNAILPIKDILGVCRMNAGNVAKHGGIQPAAATALIELLQTTGTSLENKRVLVLGCGIPHVTEALLHAGAAVTLYRKPCPQALKGEVDVVVNATEGFQVCPDDLKSGTLLINCGLAGSETGSHLSSEDFIPMVCVMITKNLLSSVKTLFQSQWNLQCIPLNFGPAGMSDIEITRSQAMKDVSTLAEEMGLLPHEIELYGDKKAKLSLSVLDRLTFRRPGKYVVVAGITPTPLGEGKSTTTIGLCQALNVRLRKNAIACLRQPSQGPTFGIKGGAAGGGYSQVVPMEDFNLHLTGDIHAVAAANNLLAAQIDTRIFHEATQKDQDLYRRLVKVVNGKKQFSKIQLARLKKLGIDKTDPDTLTPEESSRFARLDIDPESVTWHRVLDTNDRFLRKIKIGLSSTEKNMTRDTQFDIAVASEIMAILALTTSPADIKERLGRIVVANDRNGNPVTADDLGVTGALAVLLKDAVRPNLMQTLEGAPVLVHAGPFANIAHGNSSIIADQMALKIVGEDGFVVTEAGFGADVGLEKFCDIKCRASGLFPDVVVIVATVRALKLHGGGPPIAGDVVPRQYQQEDLDLVRKGFCNLAKHIEIAGKFGLPVVVALNRFSSDTDAELSLVRELSEQSGAFRCVVCSHYSQGSAGAVELAEAVVASSKTRSNFKFLYDLKAPLRSKIETIAREIYGADGVEYSERAQEWLDIFTKQGFGELPVCMAKTPLSLSDNPAKKGVPTNFTVPIMDVKLSAGAGFVYPIVGAISIMPGLPTRPCFYDMDIDPETGNIEGLS